MFKKILSAAVAICVSAAMFSSFAFAASNFSDVISPDYDWAADTIDDMTKIGIIKGYTDGTFRPANSVKNIEALIFIARCAGFSSEDYKPFIDYAADKYASMLEKYDLGASYNSYKREVAFLLYKGIISVSELDTYLKDATAPLKRYEAAILLTKLMGAEEEVKNNAAVILDYKDYAEIPAKARAYVEYVTQEKLMNGIENNCFGPNENVTRVQIAILLSRILKALDYSAVSGTIDSIDAENCSVAVNLGNATDLCTIDMDSVIIRKDGELVMDMSDIKTGSTALFLFSGDSLASFEVLSPAGSSVDIGTNEPVTKPDDSNDKPTTDNKPVTKPVKEEIEGTLRSIGEQSIKVRVATDNGNKTYDYQVAETAEITLNRKSVSLEDIENGDSVIVVLTDGIATEIIASRIFEDLTGTISSINISKNPQLGLTVDDEETIFELSRNADYILNNKASTIYDLRLGTTVDVKFEDNAIVSVTANSSSSSDYQKTGVIEDLDAQSGYIKLNIDGKTEQIYMDVDDDEPVVTIINSSTGKTLKFSKLKKGQRITALGAYYKDDFVATTIVVIPNQD